MFDTRRFERLLEFRFLDTRLLELRFLDTFLRERRCFDFLRLERLLLFTILYYKQR